MLCGRHKEETWRNTGACALCPLSAQSASAPIPNLSILPLMDRPRSLLGRPLGPTPYHLAIASSHALSFPRDHICIHSVLGTVCWPLGTGLASPSLYHVGTGNKPTLNSMTPLTARFKGWCGRGYTLERKGTPFATISALMRSLEAISLLLSPYLRDNPPSGFFQFL